MPIFTVILIGMIIYIILYSYSIKEKYMYLFLLTSILDIFWMRGALINIGSTAISNHTTFCEYSLFLYGCYYIYKEKLVFDYNLFMLGTILLALPILTVVYNFIEPSNALVAPDIAYYDSFVSGKGYSLIYSKITIPVFLKLYFKLMIFVQTVLIVRTAFNIDDIHWMLRKATKLMKMFIVFGFLEYVFRNIIGMSELKDNVVTLLIGLNDGPVEAQQRGGVYALTGLSREASHYITALYMSTLFLLLDIKVKLREHNLAFIDIIWSILPIALFLLTGGFSAIYAIGCICILGGIIFTERRNINMWSYIRLFVMILILFLVGGQLILHLQQDTYSYFGARMQLTMMVLDNLWSGNYAIAYFDSSLPRMISIIDSIKNLIECPLLGLGLGVQPAHSGFATILTGIGLLGFVAWSWFLVYGTKGKKYDCISILFVYMISLVFMGYVENYLQALPVLLAECTALYMSKEKIDV